MASRTVFVCDIPWSSISVKARQAPGLHKATIKASVSPCRRRMRTRPSVSGDHWRGRRMETKRLGPSASRLAREIPWQPLRSRPYVQACVCFCEFISP